jgi:redox-regulated HSP33 family molecular chaperone
MNENEIEQVNEQPNSVEISVNAKGQYSGKVKVYSKTIEEAFEQSVVYSEKLNSLIKLKNEGK